MIRVEMPDGTPFNPNETETPTMNETKTIAERAAALGTIRETTVNGEPGIEAVAPEERTLLTIAGELDRKQKELAAARLVVATCEADVKRLVAEVRGFGRKPRAAKAKE